MDHKITALKLQKRNRQRINVYLDGEFAFSLSRIVAAWLAVDQTISDEKVAFLNDQDDQEKAYQQALQFLNYRPRSRAEIRKNLQTHRVSEPIIASTLERLTTSGLVNDQIFAQNWIEDRVEFHPRGKRALITELRQHGLDDGVIDQAVEAIDEEKLAYQAAINQSRKLAGEDWQTFRQKLTNFLLRRGFHYDVVNPAVQKAWQKKQAELSGKKD
jgi:regulatory protein